MVAQASTSAGALHEDPGLGPSSSHAPSAVSLVPEPAPTPKPLATASATSSGFVPVSPGNPAEPSEAGPALVAAYVLMWLLLLGFVWMVARRQARVNDRLAKLEEAVLPSPRNR